MKGMTTQAAPKGGEWLATLKTNLGVAGAQQTTATAIPVGQDLSIFTTGTGGCILPGLGVTPPEEYIVANHTSSAINVYPPVGGTIGTLAQNTGYSLAAGSALRFLYLGGLAWTQGG